MSFDPYNPCPMEEHHSARQDGSTDSIPAIAHKMIHFDEREAVRNIMEQDGLTGNPGAWSLKQNSSFVQGSNKYKGI